MKKISFWLLAAILVGFVAGCGNKKAEVKEVTENQPVETCFTAIDKYLTENIGTQYLGGEVCIPFHSYVAIDESNPEDILVWGDFWVLNYDQNGDTLKTVSGGNHPGKMHVRQDKDGHFEVTDFEAVGDGSEFLPTAKEIFGDKFEDFQAANSDDQKRAAVRTDVIAEYVRLHNLPVKVYQDYGWPAVEIPVNNR